MLDTITWHWRGTRRLEDIAIEEAPSTMHLTEEQKRSIADYWQGTLTKDPKAYSEELWRYEGVRDDGKKLALLLSQTSYLQHHFKRHHPDASFTASPVGVTALQETEDGYIPAGIHTWTGELVTLGSGFVRRGPDQSILATLISELHDETAYSKTFTTPRFFSEKATGIAVMSGSEHTTGIVIYLPIPVTHREVTLANREHKDLIFVPNNPDTMARMTTEGTYRGIPVSNQLAGSLARYAEMKQSGEIGNRHKLTA